MIKENILNKQFKRVEKQEEKLLNKKDNKFIKTKVYPFINKMEEKIPTKLKATLNLTFYKGFQLIFDKGNKYIEKTYNKDKSKLQYDLNNYYVQRKLSNKNIKKLDKQSNMSKIKNTYISVAEGAILGFLGIGLPDIPLFISIIIKTIYEVELSYGFDHKNEEEKCYILLLICGAMTKGTEQNKYNKQIELLGKQIDENIINAEIDLQKQMKITSDVLSESLLTTKFIQGIAVVGVVGSIVNYIIIRKIGKFAGLKYKKRYLLKRQKILEYQ